MIGGRLVKARYISTNRMKKHPYLRKYITNDDDVTQKLRGTLRKTPVGRTCKKQQELDERRKAYRRRLNRTMRHAKDELLELRSIDY